MSNGGNPRGTPFKELILDGLTRTFGSYTAVDGLDATIRGGEFVALLGPSGCGKSTVLNLLAGLLEPTSGSIWLDDERVDTVQSEKRDFGMVFQNYALFPHLTVADNVGFGLVVRKVAKAERRRRVREALDLVQLADQADKRPAQLSGGQQQRVAIARAVVTEPRLVLMDEPLSNLDAKLRLDMRTEIRLLHQKLGLTTVYVTHDQQEALSLADRLIVLLGGVVQQIGTPQEIYQHPQTPYVAAFVGYRNRLSLTVVDAKPDATRVRGDGVELLAAGSELPQHGEVVAMMRAEDLTVTSEDAQQGPNRIPMTVRVVEYQGNHYAVEGRTANGSILHAHSTSPVRPGEEVAVAVDPQRLRLYAAPNGIDDEVALAAEGERV
ncbi:ABC transporter ATP-binding protein [Saccharopolyspora sp. K220]|uniref:ABC transporter ATP-binding protein n=1 Tax=Saccharopolyspora soli TaxID=2926618 RepID=UPI001F5650DC|nr:ABC transporter ATP-binding protein [Saccharopolyspora soli]MCI2417834.1 ABC transporter ATP-binding protein [Saccharopolyspora soli]